MSQSYGLIVINLRSEIDRLPHGAPHKTMATTIHTTTTPKPTLAGATPPATGRQRLASLDVFRGLTIAGMILVNNPGSDSFYWPLRHADGLMTSHPTDWYPGKWWVEANGWTPTDLIFPFF